MALLFGVRFHAFEDERRNADGIIGHTIEFIRGSICFPNMPLYTLDNLVRLHVLLAFCNLAYHGIIAILKVNSRSEYVFPLILVCDDFWHPVVIQSSDYRIGRAQVNSIYFCHNFNLLLS